MTSPSTPPPAGKGVLRDVVLSAEGEDDADLARYLVRGIGSDEVQVIDARGRDGLAAEVELIAKSDRFRASGRCLAVLLDADADPTTSFMLAVGALVGAGLPAPARPEVVSGAPVASGVYVTPGQQRQGAAEDLYLPCADPRRTALAGRYIDAVGAAGAEFEGPRRPDEALLQAVLAGLPTSDRQPGDGLQHGLVFDEGPLEPLRRFVTALQGAARTAEVAMADRPDDSA